MKTSPVTKVVSAALIAMIGAVVVIGVISSGTSVRNTQVVPLDYVRERGALDWNQDRVNAFLQDPKNQMVLSDAAIEQRGGRGPLEWLPPMDQCDYMSRFVAVIDRYDLATDTRESKALAEKRQQCYTQFQ
ncbi:hypothetical protein [Marinobacter confluentis]|uniref:Uncharacterized protein n=1 Tax=Marinobacter confluentis TaxID=1697557 RepID=A0A4Z1BT34_9GAMM|nr:hypothetical protein [Marinobacter confluentis]TGN41205.1 hypothetical protein E5Q11_01230 [Marinobacter confluentis]